MKIQWSDTPELVISESGSSDRRRGRRRGAANDSYLDVIPRAFLQSSRVSVERSLIISPREQLQNRRSENLPLVSLDVQSTPDEAPLLVLRHPSGAITFHESTIASERRGRAAAVNFEFRVPLRQSQAETIRRGLISQAVKAVVLKVAKPIADGVVSFLLPKLVRAWENSTWKQKKLSEGWFQIVPQQGEFKLVNSIPDSSERALLFLHGTFSNGESAFGSLAKSAFFDRIRQQYRDRIYAFNHYSLSKSTTDNAQELLNALPSHPQTFDVVTHSRGGLVLRTLVEEAGSLIHSNRFAVGQVVLVASPNDGTPLATPQRWDQTIGWFANLLEIIDKLGVDNPFLTGAEFVSEAIVWLAHHASGDLPGLRSMDSGGEIIAKLQAPPPPPDVYSALVANYNPDDSIWRRMVDVGVDQFFGSANDLVVPSEGGWRVDHDGLHHVDAARIGCFGTGGNLAPNEAAPVMHTSFFSRPETVDFMVNALQGKPQSQAPIDPDRPLPDRRFLRRAATVPTLAPRLGAPQEGVGPAPIAQVFRPDRPARSSPESTEVFYISVLSEDPKRERATLLATFRNARATQKINIKRGMIKRIWRKIMDTQSKIQRYIDGDPRVPQLPSGDELIELGKVLFYVLFGGNLRRLYDVARAEQPDGRISLIFTSMADWIAVLPWEFVYDPQRKNFLSTSEVNFTRNVDTGVPADRMEGKAGKLRILVVVAQPLGLGHLSVDDEVAVIKSGFCRLTDAGLAEVDVVLDATPALLHQKLEIEAPYDILHFIGHGEYEAAKRTGFLLFEDEQGGSQKVDYQVLQQIICRREIRLVFLNACETGQGGKTDFNRGVAPALVAGGVPAVVGNQYSVLDVSATSFARHFYWALAQGRSIGEAAREARIAVNYSISGEAIDWAVPVVFARDPADKLCARTAGAGFQATPEAVNRARRRAMPDRKRVALWDVQRIIPNLEAIANRLTNTQSVYSFESVSISAPLGTWRREVPPETKRAKDEKALAYINAQRVIERLFEKPRELGVALLIAFTNLPLTDDEGTEGLYAWDDDVARIGIFSFNCFIDQIKPPYTLDRAIANAVAGFIGSLPSHTRGPKTCPFYYNDDVEIEYIAGPLTVCAADVKKLRKRDESKVKVLEALLCAYP